MNAKKNQVKISLEKKLRERVRRSKEPFRGTLASVSFRPSAEKPEVQPTEDKRELTSKENTPFAARLRERVNSSSVPFKGCLSSKF